MRPLSTVKDAQKTIALAVAGQVASTDILNLPIKCCAYDSEIACLQAFIYQKTALIDEHSRQAVDEIWRGAEGEVRNVLHKNKTAFLPLYYALCECKTVSWRRLMTLLEEVRR